jgi:signal transduction histidine kinase
MAELAQKLVEELKPTLGERKVNFEIKQLPSAYGDFFMVNQVLVNLLTNALKFTQPRDPAMIEIGGYAENDENIYYVRDKLLLPGRSGSRRKFPSCNKREFSFLITADSMSLSAHR